MTHKGQIAADVVRRLRAAGFETYFAGGCVRDRLLAREPGDYDVATAAPPEEVRRIFRRTVAVGAQFGVILVLEGDAQFEVATFRSDDAYVDGRRPTSVRFATAEEDAQRRDFTVNALFQDPETGDVIDFVGGQADLRAGVIRAIGDAGARIREDRLRMLRAVRFAARFDWTIEPGTLAAVRAAAPSVTDMAAERIGDEIVKMLTEGRARRAFELLDETGLLAVVLPEIDAMHGVEQSPDYHPEGDVWIHTLRLLGQLEPGAPETLALGCLLHDVAKPTTAAWREDLGRITFYGHPERGAVTAVAIVQRLKRSRETWERVEYLVHNHLRLVQASEMRLSTLKRMLAEQGFDELLALARIDALASNGDLQFVEFCIRRRDELRESVKPPRLLGGSDLIALGFAPGPALGETLRALETAQLEGEITTRDEALAWVRARTG